MKFPKRPPTPVRQKIQTPTQLARQVKNLQRQKKVVVVTAGAFDILHPGHIVELRKARSFGDILIVNILNDQRIGIVKNVATDPHVLIARPIQKQFDRAAVIAALEIVDYVTIHAATRQSPTVQLVGKIKPDIYYVTSVLPKQELQWLTSQSPKTRVIYKKSPKPYSSTAIIKSILNRSRRAKKHS